LPLWLVIFLFCFVATTTLSLAQGQKLNIRDCTRLRSRNNQILTCPR
jgi:hypothetical protein